MQISFWRLTKVSCPQCGTKASFSDLKKAHEEAAQRVQEKIKDSMKKMRILEPKYLFCKGCGSKLFIDLDTLTLRITEE